MPNSIEKIQFPRRSFVAAVIVSGLVTIWLAWSGTQSYEHAVTSGQNLASLERIKGKVIHLDEVLTMSARMAAATEDLNWETRYRRAEKELNDIITNALELSGQSVAPVTTTQKANDKLVEIENRAFDLIRSGQAAAARAMLRNDVYGTLKSQYAQGMQDFIDQMHWHLNTAKQEQKTKAILSFIAASLSFAYVLAVWIYVFSRIKTWHTLIASAYEMKQRVAAEIAGRRDHLEQVVEARTAEAKQHARELELALTKEKELSEMQRQFVSMASHEFRTPLSIIDGVAQRIKSRANSGQLTPQDTVQRVEKIRTAVQRMTRLMESTLTVARMEKGMIKVEIGPCDIANVVREVCERQQEIAQAHVISCDLVNLPETIQADPGCLEQVFTNLLSNAVKYAPDAANIEVIARVADSDVVILVRDHGIGIDEDDLPRIGERFFRAKNSTGITGTGIGLSLANALVKDHDGVVMVESKKGKGSTFTVRLPIAGPDQSQQVDTRAA